MRYKVTIYNNNEHNAEFNSYECARNYCETVSHAFSIPIFLFRINDKFINQFKLKSILYERKFKDDKVSEMQL